MKSLKMKELKKETAKAYQVTVEYKNEEVTTWLPKSSTKLENGNVIIKERFWAHKEEELLDSLKPYKLWTPDHNYFRVYFGNDYIEINIKDKAPSGYYESHRYCKGERFATGYYKLNNITVEKFESSRSLIFQDISQLSNLTELVESKY